MIVLCGIYRILSPSGKIYVGRSVNIFKRWRKYSFHNCLQKRKLMNLGKSHSAEAIEKIKLHGKGMKRSQETCENIRKSKMNNTYGNRLLLHVPTGTYYYSLKEACHIFQVTYNQLVHRLGGRTVNNLNLIYA